MARAKTAKMNVYEMVTSRILSALESGTIPWHKPWVSKDGEFHSNLKSKKTYRGINQILLSMSAMAGNYSSPYWLSFKQAKEFGGSVRKGEKGTLVVFYKPVKKEDSKTGNAYLILRYYYVWNVEQCDGLESKIPATVVADEKPFSPIETAEAILAGMPNPPKFSEGGSAAFYDPNSDSVKLPNREDFESEEYFYWAAFHEFSHSTGHKSRLNRWSGESKIRFGDEKYSAEELIAEFSAAMLCGIAGIENHTLDNSAAYIDHWKKQFSADPKLVVKLAGKGQRAADCILGTTWDAPAETDTEDENALGE